MSTIGHSNHFLMYKHPATQKEQEANRRVEINVISIGKDTRAK